MSGDRPRFDPDDGLSVKLGVWKLKYAILDESGEVLPATMLEWSQWFERNGGQRIIEQTDLACQITVSTVFLGLNHQYGAGPPLYFETMIFGPPKTEWSEVFGREHTFRSDLWISRTSTLAQAKAAHAEGIEWVKIQDWFINERLPS